MLCSFSHLLQMVVLTSARMTALHEQCLLSTHCRPPCSLLAVFEIKQRITDFEAHCENCSCAWLSSMLTLRLIGTSELDGVCICSTATTGQNQSRRCTKQSMKQAWEHRYTDTAHTYRLWPAQLRHECDQQRRTKPLDRASTKLLKLYWMRS